MITFNNFNPKPSIHQELEEKGYAVVDFLTETEIQSLLRFDKNHSLPNELIFPTMSFSINTSDVLYRQLVTQEIKKVFTPKLAALFSEYRIVLGNLVRKKPDGLSSIMPLHQDPSLVDEASLKAFGVWCPFIDVNEQNGCLQVVKKSHLLNSKLRPLIVFNGFPYSQDILSLMEDRYLTSVPMKAGQALIYDKRLFHGSPSNSTTVERVATICSLVPEEIWTHLCYKDSTFSKLKLFEVDDEFYDRYIVGKKPEGVKSLGVFDYEVDPLTPELLVQKLERRTSKLDFPILTSCEISLKTQYLEKFNPSIQKIAILATNEFEGFSKNGGIGTYYTSLSQKLAADGWYVILLLCQSEIDFQGEASFPHVASVFSTHEIAEVLNLQPIHHKILSTTQQDPLSNSFDYQSFCCLFFTQAVVASFPDAVVYVEFPDIWGFGYRTIQAKQTGLLGSSCLIGVTTHGCFEWLREVNSKYAIDDPQWFWQAYHYEQFCYENADVAYFPSYFLKSKLESYGWKTAQANHLPYFIPIVQLLGNEGEADLTPQTPLPYQGKGELNSPPRVGEGLGKRLADKYDSEKIPVVFFGRLEERKGLCTFLDAINLLEPSVAEKIQIIFIGKIIPLQSSQLQHLDSQQYIQQELDSHLTYNLLPNLSSQDAIQFIAKLNHPIVCLTSLQENFPNTSLEIGQLPVSLVVSDTGGFRETLNLIKRSDCVRHFQPGKPHSLVQTITQAINAYPEKPLIPERDFLEQVNQRLLNQRLEYMSEAFVNAAPKELKTPSVTIGIVCLHPAKNLLNCLESLAAQTYDNFDVIILYKKSTDESVEEIFTEAKTNFPNYKYSSLDINWTLGETYNYLVNIAAGEYFLQFPAECIALPDMVEKLVTATWEADADAVVCPQMTLGEDGSLENLALVDGSLLKLLEFKHDRDISALFSVKLLKEFPYCQERELLALNWHVLAAAIATDKQIAYYPYPLYVIDGNLKLNISPRNIPKERYYLRQYLYQIEPSKWNQRQMNLLLTGVEQLLQQQQISPQNCQQLSLQPQAWMLTAQQIQEELTQTQANLKNLQAWNQQLQAGKDWLESQWQTWMLKAQKAEAELARSQFFIKMMENSKFWKLRNAWFKFKKRVQVKNADPLLALQVDSNPQIQEFVALIAGQKVKFFQPEPCSSPVVSIISSFFNDFQYFETTYRSVINQTFQNFEWIIVDDGSTDDDAIALIKSLPQRTGKIKVLSHHTNKGVAAGRNTAIAEAKGKYLFFIDLDDIIDPTYIEKCVLFLETYPEFSFVNSYSAVFQAQEQWWNRGFNQPASFFQENHVKGGLMYRKGDFEKLGGFDEDLGFYEDWERWLRAIANHQQGWTIPEYLDCDRCINSPVFEQNNSELQRVTELIQSRYREFFTNTPPQEIFLNRQPLVPEQLKLKVAVENPQSSYYSGKRLLCFFPCLDSNQFNLDLVTRLEQQGYEIAIATTLNSSHPWQESFYRVTPDIFHLPNFLDPVHWLVFTRYIIASRHIDVVVIANVDIAYYFLPLLRAEFPQVAFINCIHTGDRNFSSIGYSISGQFSQYLDSQVVFSTDMADVDKDMNSKTNSKVICSNTTEIEAAFTSAIQARQTSNQAEIDTELAIVALLLALR